MLSDRPLRILYIIDEMESLTAGGTERQILQMIAMAKRDGAEPCLCILRKTEWLDDSSPDVPIQRYCVDRLLSFKGISEVWKLFFWIRRQHFDVVHSFFVEANMIAPVLAWIAGVPVRIGSRRNLNHWMTSRYRFLQSVSNIFVTRLAANCVAVKDTVERTEKFASGRVDVIYNGLDVMRFHPDPNIRAAKRAALGIAEEEVVIGNTSTLRDPKGVPDFLRASAQVLKRTRGRILIIGDGPQRSQLEQLAAQLGVADRTVFAGAQTDVPPWLGMMDIAVLSSHAEGFSNSILEYMAAGLPCVVTDVGGNAEALAGCGRVVPAGAVDRLAAEIETLAQSFSLRQQLADCSLKRAGTFNLETSQSTLMGYYRRLVSES